MSWLQKLYETYECCAGAPRFDREPLQPVGYARQQAHIEVILNERGEFLRASVLRKEETPIPATEQSAGRTSGLAPHGLCDKVQYCAGDHRNFAGAGPGDGEAYTLFLRQLEKWVSCDETPQTRAILDYVRRGTLVADLVGAGVLWLDPNGHLARTWNNPPVPPIFGVLTPKAGERDQGSAFVRWRVEVPGMEQSAVWENPSVQRSWVRFLGSLDAESGLCFVSGQVAPLASNHPKRIRHAADGAKLISSNDKSGYTFLGRFGDDREAAGIAYEVTQKAHNALRWLIQRQAYRAADQEVVVAWATTGAPVPDPLGDTAAIFDDAGLPPSEPVYSGDAGQQYALRLGKAIAGYAARLDGSETIVVLGLDSATPGRMAVTYHRQLSGSEFLDRLLRWHQRSAWPQKYGDSHRFTGAPAPRDIVEAAYGVRADSKLRRSFVERLLPCIVDGLPLPVSLVDTCCRRAANRVSLKPWEWEKCLGIACALFRGSSKESYDMALEEDRNSRDYLYGRLLAVAEDIESRALYLAGEQRDTTAAKLMQRFAAHPFSTWRNIEIALAPYKARLRSRRAGLLRKRETLMDDIHARFQSGDFADDRRLSGEFLLGYHCQRTVLRNIATGQAVDIDSNESDQGEQE